MTTAVAVFGLIPAALSTAIGSQSQRPLTLVIAGGLIPGVVLALFVLPTLFGSFNMDLARHPRRLLERKRSQT